MNKEVKVVSLFDGLSGGMIALERAGFKVTDYQAFEIDENAIAISHKNYPDIHQNGTVVDADFSKFAGYDLLLGGSPCQELSKQNKNASIGFKGSKSVLFYEYVRALEAIKPKYFLLENVASMNPENKDIISERLGVQPILINSSVVSAQYRRRLYWTNIPGVIQPASNGKVLNDILVPLKDVPKDYYVTKPYHIDDVMSKTCGWIDTKEFKTTRQIYSQFHQCNALQCDPRNNVYQDGVVRRLMPIECERLQTLPDNYTDNVAECCRYKAIGNGWTIDVIKYILSFIKDI